MWKSFPAAEDARFDYFLTDPIDERSAWLQRNFLPDGKLCLLGRTLDFWNGATESGWQPPLFSISGFRFNGRDGSRAVAAGGRL
ncbi:MAG: hypothetical protein AAB225_29255 [Acidobacteriota bacterium]